jgi:adenosylhomocysteine nucleosidase
MQPAVAVLTALPLEYRAVRGHLTNTQEIEHRTGTKAVVGQLPDSPWSIALLELGPNNLSAAALTERVLSWLDPEAVLFVGVAGSLKRDIHIGDVVVATKVYGIHGGKETPEGFKTRPEAWRASYRLLEAARAALRDDPHAHLKPIAAGEVVVAAARSALVEHLRTNYNDAVAIEMEGAGVAAAVDLAGGHALIIRGISDRADAAKSREDAEGSQVRAADRAAAAAMAVLREFRPFRGRSESGNGPSDPEEGPHRRAGIGGDHLHCRGNAPCHGTFVATHGGRTSGRLRGIHRTGRRIGQGAGGPGSAHRVETSGAYLSALGARRYR